MSRNCTHLTIAAAFATLTGILAPPVGPAMAGARITQFGAASNCGIINCSSLTIPGTVTNPGGFNDPFEIDVFAFANECVRLEVTRSVENVDLSMVVRAPNGAIYFNDDGNGAVCR